MFRTLAEILKCECADFVVTVRRVGEEFENISGSPAVASLRIWFGSDNISIGRADLSRYGAGCLATSMTASVTKRSGYCVRVASMPRNQTISGATYPGGTWPGANAP